MRSVRDPETDELRDSLSRDWSRYLHDLGMTIVPTTNQEGDPSEMFVDCHPDALLLTNGEDVGAHPPRDRTERKLIKLATEANVPILGVCRGHQFLNVFFGGTVEKLDENTRRSHAGTEHEVTICNSPLRPEFGETLSVNSYHDMGITLDMVASPLRPFAVSREGNVVEGTFHLNKSILTMQWHPERKLSDRNKIDSIICRFLDGELSW